MGDDDLVALLDEAEKRVGGVAHGLDLLGRGVAEGVAAEGDDDAVGLAERLRHSSFLSNQRRVKNRRAPRRRVEGAPE